MQTTTFSDFRSHASHYLSVAEAGESTIIMRHGKAVAKLCPISNEDIKKSWQHPPLQLNIKGVSLSKALLDDRKKSR